MMKEWGSEIWDADVWEDHDEAEEIEIINSDESFWVAKLSLHLHLRRLTLNSSGPPWSQQSFKTSDSS